MISEWEAAAENVACWFEKVDDGIKTYNTLGLEKEEADANTSHAEEAPKEAQSGKL